MVQTLFNHGSDIILGFHILPVALYPPEAVLRKYLTS
jgi:hypothetical protein